VYALRQHVFDIDGRPMYHGGDRHRLDIIEMGHCGMCFKLGAGCDACNAGIVWKQRRLTVGDKRLYPNPKTNRFALGA
jgi:hypothetical protein